MVTARNSNEAVVLDFFAGLNSGNEDQVRAQLSPDISWKPMVTGVDGYNFETVFSELLPYLRSIFAPGEPQQAVQTVTSTDDRVVVETHCTGHVPSKENRLYDSRYCWVIELADGKIKAIREYLDIDKIRAVFG